MIYFLLENLYLLMALLSCVIVLSVLEMDRKGKNAEN